MPAIFPGKEWLNELEAKLNSDEKYAEVARNWEGDLFIVVEPEGNLKERLAFYLDLWHGKCRKTVFNPGANEYPNAAFTMTATYNNIKDIMTGKLNPMTAMMTMKMKVKGNMGYMMRNVPVVLDFVRCMQETTTEIL